MKKKREFVSGIGFLLLLMIEMILIKNRMLS